MLLLPGKATEKDKKEKEKINYSVTTITKLRKTIHNRPSSTKYLFATEIFNVAQSLADVLKCFVSQKELSINKCDSAVLHDLSILVKSQYVDTIKTFSDFLANSENKSILNEFLAKSFIEEHVGNQILVVTYKDIVFSNNNTLVMDEDIAICLTEEADQRFVRHAYNCFRNNIFSVVISTNDTDIVMLLIANFPYMYDTNSDINLYCLFGKSDSKRIYIINELAVQIGFERCKGFSFFHAFTGCNTVSSFLKYSKQHFFIVGLHVKTRNSLKRSKNLVIHQ